jgi:hypothetical protein
MSLPRPTRLRQALAFCIVILLLHLLAAPASAQDPGPIGPFVIDVRGSMVNVGQDPDLAANRGLGPAQLPAWGLGLDVGGHVYLFRLGVVTFGLGASALFTSTGRTPGESDPDAGGPAVTTRFTAFSPQLSFNFGDGNGWSYLSGGLGTSRFTVSSEQLTVPAQRRAGTLNYGGGARWFLRPRVAFSLDLRLFAISPLQQTATEPGSPRMTRLALNMGVSFK